MQQRPRLLTAGLAAAVISTLGLTACGSSSSSKSATGAATSAAGAATSAAATVTGGASPSDTSAASSPPSSAASGGSGGSTGVGCDAAKGKTVGYSEPIPDPNFASIEAIMRTELTKFGVSLKTTNANLNPGKQLSDIRTLLQSGVNVLVVNPLAPQAIVPALDEVRAKNVPIVAQESTSVGTVATDVTADVESAAQGAADLIKAAGITDNVAEVTAPPLAEILIRENTAFAKAAAADGIKVVATQANTMISPNGAKAIADSYKQKYGSALKAIWTFNDTSATGIASSLGSGFNPQLYSINGQPEAIQYVKSGAITATWDLRQDKLGQALAYSSLKALCGQSLPSQIVIPVTKLTKDNVGSYRPLSDRVNDPFDIQLEQVNGRATVKVSG